jgi:enoyl-CoA hydratase/carnithine racemase
MICRIFWFGTSFSLPDQVGYLRAAEIVLLGHPFDASSALSMGLVTEVLPDAEVLATAEEVSQECSPNVPYPTPNAYGLHLYVIPVKTCAVLRISAINDVTKGRLLQEYVIVSERCDCYSLAERFVLPPS